MSIDSHLEGPRGYEYHPALKGTIWHPQASLRQLYIESSETLSKD